MDFVEIDGCPVPKGRAEQFVRDVKKRDSSLRLTSVYRGSDPKAAGILRRFGKSTQAWLYRAYWILHLPGYRPANPVGFSTHELFNDGVAYKLPRGWPLKPWQVGMDWNNGPRAAQVGREAGYRSASTYPGKALEVQHVNLFRKPRLRKKFKVLKRGSKGFRVRKLQVRLRFLGFLNMEHVTGRFGESTERALKDFQRKHGMKADGIYGRHSHDQVMASYRWHRKHPKGKVG